MPAPSPSRRTAALLLAIAIAAGTSCAASRLINYKVSPDHPRGDRDETLALPGLVDAVTVRFDEAGIPYVFATNDMDLTRALGYLHGRERFFQMDGLRRYARGRIAELIGDQPFGAVTSVQQDARMRAWGIEEAVVAEAAALDAPWRARLQAYADGVNAAVERHLPLEHRLLDVPAEPWTIEDSLAVGLLQAWSLTTNWQQEASRLVLAWWGGLERMQRIYPPEAPADELTFPAAGFLRTLPPAVSKELRAIFPGQPPPVDKGGKDVDLLELSYAPLRGGASNAWAVAGDRTASGKPIVAGDPHLQHMLPGLMFPSGLRTPAMEVAGFTVPGLPVLLIGHDRKVAWSLTAAGADGADLYVERPDPARPDHVMVPGGGYEPLRSVPLFVKVRTAKGMETRVVTVRASRHGVLLNDLYPDVMPAGLPPVALQWVKEGSVGTLKALDGMARASTVGQVREALRDWTVPGQVITTGDDSGSIGVFLAGRFPVRTAHRGTFPVPGWTAEDDWKAFVDPDRLPGGESRTGFLAHANNVVMDPLSGPSVVQVEAAPPHRHRRIVELLSAADRLTPDLVADVQVDTTLLQARRVAPRMLEDLVAQRDDDPVMTEAFEALRHWDCRATEDSPAATLYHLTFREAAFQALEDEADRAGVIFVLSNGWGSGAIDAWFEDPRHPVWDDRRTPQVETRADVVQAAFGRAVERLKKRFGPHVEKWAWGQVHRQRFQHAFGDVSSLKSYVNLPDQPAAGGQDSVWKSQFWMGRRGDDFTVVSGPVLRMVVDLADVDHGRWVVDTGVSGWPGSPHYGDQNALWRKGKSLPMRFSPDEIRDATKGVLTLVPPGRPK